MTEIINIGLMVIIGLIAIFILCCVFLLVGLFIVGWAVQKCEECFPKKDHE